MSTKIYNGVKFKSNNLPEIIHELYSVKEQAVKNSNQYQIEHPDRVVHTLLKNGFVDDIEDFFNEELLDSKKCWEGGQIISESLEKTWRPRGGPDFLFNICIIPWTDGNIYGCVYADDILENLKLTAHLYDEYYYQNQTDKPDDIPDEEWEERSDVWNQIFDEYFAPSDAGLVYEIVKADDFDYFNVEKIIQAYRDLHVYAYDAKCVFKTEDALKQIKERHLIEDIDNLGTNVMVQNFTTIVDIKDFNVIALTEDDVKRASEILSKHTDIIDFEFKKRHIKNKYFEENLQNLVKKHHIRDVEYIGKR